MILEIQLHIVRVIHVLLFEFKRTLRRPRSGRLGTSEEVREVVGVKACGGDLTKLVILVAVATSSCGV